MRLKKITICIVVCYLFVVGYNASASTAHTGMRTITSLELTADMGMGWNLGNTLDASPGSETSWGNPMTTKAMLDEIRKKGFKTIRIPTTWYSHLGAAPDYVIDPAWLDRVEVVANYAFDNDMYVILNLHHEEGNWLMPTSAKQTAATNQLVKIWTQIANRFITYGDYLIFETMNEPRLVGSPEEWSGGTTEGRDVVNKYNLAAVNAIRATGGNNALRHIMIPTYSASDSDVTINALVIPNNDNRVIVSLHSYSPYSFCLQVTGGTSTWGTAADKASLNTEFDRLYNKFIKNGRAVVIGEWASLNKNNLAARTTHADYFVKAATVRHMPTVWWDNGDLLADANGLAIFNRKTLAWDYSDIANAIVAASVVTVTVTGVGSNVEVHNFDAYPNPVSDKLNLNLSPIGSSQIGLYSIQGEQMINLNAKGAQMEIDMTSLKPGIYVLKVISSDQNRIQKIIKD